MTKPKSNIYERTGWAFFILACASFVAMTILPNPYGNWCHLLWLVFSAAFVAFLFGDAKPPAERLKNAVVVCVAIGVFSALTYGIPEHDESGNVVFEGFRSTFNSKAGVGVRVFLKLMAGAAIGIFVSDFLRTSAPD